MTMSNYTNYYNCFIINDYNIIMILIWLIIIIINMCTVFRHNNNILIIIRIMAINMHNIYKHKQQ